MRQPFSDYEGLYGKWSIDKNGDTTLRLVTAHQIVDGQFKFVKRLDHP
jgi:hypothetical protein